MELQYEPVMSTIFLGIFVYGFIKFFRGLFLTFGGFEIRAEVVDVKIVTRRNLVSYSPVVKYHFNGKDYIRRIIIPSPLYIYTPGEFIDIKISTLFPGQFLIERRSILVFDFFLTISGAVMFFVSINGINWLQGMK